MQRAQQRALQSLHGLIEAIDKQLQASVKADAALEQKRCLLQTIAGVGLLNSLALTQRLTRTPFQNSDALVAAYGMDPRPKDSGNKVGRRRLTKQGNGEDRRLIYLAAQSAAKTQTFQPIYRALRAKGFATTEAIVIIERQAPAHRFRRMAFKPTLRSRKNRPSGLCKTIGSTLAGYSRD